MQVGNSYFPTCDMKENIMSITKVNDARVMSKGQVTIPKDIRQVLGIESGDRVTFIVEGNTVRVVNSAVYAMMRLQEQMQGNVQQAGLANVESEASNEDVMAISKRLIKRNKEAYEVLAK